MWRTQIILTQGQSIHIQGYKSLISGKGHNTFYAVNYDRTKMPNLGNVYTAYLTGATRAYLATPVNNGRKMFIKLTAEDNMKYYLWLLQNKQQ
jgi:hypothetical protein